MTGDSQQPALACRNLLRLSDELTDSCEELHVALLVSRNENFVHGDFILGIEPNVNLLDANVDTVPERFPDWGFRRG